MTRYEKFLKERQKENPDFFENIFNVGAINDEPVECDCISCDDCKFEWDNCAKASVGWLREEVEA